VALQNLFREYVDARIDIYRLDFESQEWEQASARATVLQNEIWSAAVSACPRGTTPASCTLLLPSLNSMIDIATTRLVATWIHPPTTVYVMLVALALAAAMLTGYGTAFNAHRNWLHRTLFASAITAAVFVTLDLEFPRVGLIRVDSVDQLIIDLRRSFDP
jgi:hypothetical protein